MHREKKIKYRGFSADHDDMIPDRRLAKFQADIRYLACRISGWIYSRNGTIKNIALKLSKSELGQP
jgi:hypothetical protein